MPHARHADARCSRGYGSTSSSHHRMNGSTVIGPVVTMRRYGAKTRALAMGHHRTSTRPRMYFCGTGPKKRLSELLFR